MVDEVKTNEDGVEYTHKATMTVFSNGPTKEISLRIKWDPDIEGVDIKELGYLPSSYQFIEEYILPAIEEAYMAWTVGPLLNAESPSEYNN